jgi:hypothetical protein
VEEEGKIEDEALDLVKMKKMAKLGVGQFGDGLVEKSEEDWPT